jgi:LmbE family N-acetylglucosaminyl deacetylase
MISRLQQRHRSLNAARRSLTKLFAWIALVVGHRRAAAQLAARTLVFAPHPDDEVLGCGGTIARKVELGSAVRVVMMTDGSASHAKFIEPRELAALRREEALAAARALGLSTADYEFLDFPDHALAGHRDAAIAAVTRILSAYRPAEIFIPHRHDRLEDHVATNDVVRSALSQHPHAVRVFEYPVWLWNTWPWTEGHAGGGRLWWARNLRDALRLTFGCRAHVEVQTVAHRKANSLDAYGSQVTRKDGDPAWPILVDVSGGEFLARFRTGVEVFREWVHTPYK